MKVIGVAGTAKNTGKTTTLIELLAAAPRLGLTVALTSIGYDGEARDHLTGLAKPRVDVPAGTLVATVERLAFTGTARLEPIARTGALTPLGEVVVARCTAPGRCVLAGPMTGAALRQVLAVLQPLGVHLCLVDGAFGRMAPMLETDGLVLATGAARQHDLSLLVAETAAIAWLFQMKVIGEARRHIETVGSLLTNSDGAALAQRLAQVTATRGPTRVEVRGAITEAALIPLAAAVPTWPARVGWRFADPVKLALAGSATRTKPLLRQLARNGSLGVARSLPLLGVTVNPFWPEPYGQGFRPRYLDARDLEEAMAAGLPVPVANLLLPGSDRGAAVVQAILAGAAAQDV